MLDAFGRKIDYIRLSITDRCNQRCLYCMPEEGIAPITHDDVLRYEEVMLVARAAIRAGIFNFKVTGGEPLVRKGCVNFLRGLKSMPGAEHVTLTTNGVLLEPVLNDLYEMKIDGINISLDSLDSSTYIKITGRDNLPVVLSALDKALSLGLKIKVNCVPMRGINDNEIEKMAKLAESMPVDVRFIEFMTEYDDMRITGTEIMKRLLEVYPDLVQDSRRRGLGPARYFKSARMRGSIGIIDAVENCFCEYCNRVRLTSDGFLKLCLFHDDGVDLRKLIRGGAGPLDGARGDRARDGGARGGSVRDGRSIGSKGVGSGASDSGTTDSELESALLQAIYNKPKRHLHMGVKNMSQIGG